MGLEKSNIIKKNIIIIGIVLLLILSIILIDRGFSTCLEKRNLCYTTFMICSKGCIIYSIPTECSSKYVDGNKTFCVKRTSFIFKKDIK
jgi:hypothetical protein